MDHASPIEPLHELPADVVTQPADAGIDVPYALGTLPDGRETLIIGDVDTYADFTHRQGDNPYGFQGTCGLCSCEGVLRQFGVDVTEGDVVAHAVAHGLCETGGDVTARGGTTLPDQARILSDYGVPARVESADSLEDLAANLEQGHGVIIAANAGVLWDEATYWDGGQANHAVVPIGVARDPATGEIEGFFVNDSGTGESARFVDAATMADSWLGAGGNCVVTDQVHAAAPGEGTPL